MRRTLSRALMSLAFVFATGVGGVVAKDEPAPKGDAKDKPTAAGPSLHYARSYADAVAEAKDRGCALFITFHGDG